MVEGRDGLPHRLLEVGEVHDHAAHDGTLGGHLHFPRVAVRHAALGVAGKEMHTVEITDAADFHEGSSKPVFRNDSIRPRQALQRRQGRAPSR